MLPTNETMIATRQVIDEQIDKRIEKLEKEKYWDWQTMDDTGNMDRCNAYFVYLTVYRSYKQYTFYL
jgi:adenosyl cobinamide kinase/adenosyl cobinamide phosphate guanylyltransferase